MSNPETVFVRLKVPLATRQEWQKQAADQGMTLSDLIRQRMGDQPVAEPKRRAAASHPAQQQRPAHGLAEGFTSLDDVFAAETPIQRLIAFARSRH